MFSCHFCDAMHDSAILSEDKKQVDALCFRATPFVFSETSRRYLMDLLNAQFALFNSTGIKLLVVPPPIVSSVKISLRICLTFLLQFNFVVIHMLS